MSTRPKLAPDDHPAYRDSLRSAADKARRLGGCFSVYFDGDEIYVRASEAAAPKAARLVCIAQVWDDTYVQLRFDGAWSEWVEA